MRVSSCFQAESPTGRKASSLISEEEQQDQQTRTSHKLGAVQRLVCFEGCFISPDIIQYHQEENTKFSPYPGASGDLWQAI